MTWATKTIFYKVALSALSNRPDWLEELLPGNAVKVTIEELEDGNRVIKTMTGQYIVQGIFALAGIVSLLASLLNWDWFFTTRNAQTIVRNVGRNRARLFYGILGIIIIGMAVFFFVETRKAIGG